MMEAQTHATPQVMTENQYDHHPGSWRDELHDILRAVAGGFIFAIPLLYTMEMWSIGATAELWKLLLFLGVAFVISLALAHSRTGGFKAATDRFATIEQAIDGLAVGLLGAVVVLLVLNRIQLGDPLANTIGKVIAQTVSLSIGAAVATAIFGARGERSRQGDEVARQERNAAQALRADVGATTIGAIFLGFSIAPTDEVSLLAAELTAAHQAAVIALSLLLSYIIVFASGYGSGQRQQPGPFQHPLTETVLAYVIALSVALIALALFDRIEVGDPIGHIVALVLVLGLPTTIGGAAGRLVV